ncbi:MAG: Calx-beta domain-containing protein [Phycisphaerales bacterium]|nr:Calx-beta domain-containing protein [Phycisphaerales bacterium]
MRTFSNLRIYLPYGTPGGDPLNPGAYRVSVIVDPTNDVAESNEGNNATISPTANITVPARNVGNDPAGADLRVYAYPISGSYQPGQTINVATIFSNLGNAEATGGVTLSAYLSTDSVFDGGDILLSGDVFGGSVAVFAVGSLYGNVALTIPSNAPTGAFYIIFRADADGTVAETDDENNSASTGTATVTRAVVSITASDAAAAESSGVANPGQFRVTRTGPTTAALVVYYSVSGTAENGVDYTTLTGSVTIPAGATSATFNVNVIDDGLAEITETVTVTLDTDDAYDVTTVVSRQQSTVNIADNEPIVTLTTVDAAAAETTGGQAANGGTFRVTRPSTNTAGDLVVNYTVTGTATGGDDYVALSGTVTILAGQTSATFSVVVTDDLVAEGSETVIVTLNADNAYRLSTTASQRTGTVTIADNEPTVTLTTVDATAAETVVGQTPSGGVFRVTRPTSNTAGDLVVRYTVTGTAVNGTDYETLSGTVTILDGQASATFSVTVIDDALAESTETVIVTLTADDAYNLSTTAALRSGTVTIADNEAVVSIVANDAAAAETSGTANNGQFRVTRTGPTGEALEVFFTISGTATNGDDYTLITSSVVIPIGASSATIDIGVIDDALAEANETVVITLDANTTYNITGVVAQRSATVTIADNEPIVVLTATDAAAAERAAGLSANGGQFRVTRPSSNTAGDMIVHYTVSGTATNGDDYTLLTGTVTILDGQTSATIDVVVTDDALAESTETVIVTLVADDAYRLSTSAAQRSRTVTILDNEPTVTLSTVDTIGAETSGVQAANNAQFRVTRPSTNTAGDLVVHYSVSGSATNGDDYTLLTGTVTILDGQTTATIDVVVTDDLLAEPTETVTLTLVADDAYRLPTSATQLTRTVTIADNEPIITLIATDAIAGEVVTGGTLSSGNFRVVRTGGDMSQQLTINVLVTGTASNLDWIDFIGTEMAIPANAAFYDNPVIIFDDALWEGSETIVITLQPGAGYHVTTIASRRVATVTIADNESTVTVTANDRTAAEIPTGTQNPGSFRINRAQGSNAAALSVFYTITGTATNGTDYVVLTGTATIPAGEAFVYVPVVITDDLLAENTETVIMTLNADASYRLGSTSQRTATVTITDNEPTVTVTASDAAAAEVTGGTPNRGQFRVTRTGGTTADLVVNYTITGTATNGDDYTLLTGTVTIPIGATSAVIDVNVTDDGVAEPAETVIVTLDADPAYRLGTAAQQTARVTIADNAATVTLARRDGVGAEVTTGTANLIVYRITRTGARTADLVVNYTMSGTATSGDDYEALSGTVTIPAGAAFVDVTLTVIDDLIVEGTETAIMTLTPDSAYRLGSAAQQAVAATIADNEPTFAVVRVDGSAAETPSGTVNTGSFAVRRTGGNTGQTSVVNFSVSGSATPGVDYTLSMTPIAGATFDFDSITGEGTVTFSGTVTQVTLIVTPALDVEPEATETVVINLLAADPGSQQYTLSGTQNTASLNIANAVFADLAAISIGSFSLNTFSRSATGQQMTFDVNIENQGTTTLTSVRVTLFLQAAGGARTNIGTMTFAVNLAPGQATTLSPTLTLSGFPAIGTYTPGATVAILTGGSDVITGNNAVTDAGSPIDVTA